MYKPHSTIRRRCLPQYHWQRWSRDESDPTSPFFNIYYITTEPSRQILCYLCLIEFVEGSKFFLTVGRKLLTQSCLCPRQVSLSHRSETPWWSTSRICHFHFSGDCFGFQPDQHRGNPSYVCSLCLLSLQECVQVQPIGPFFLVFLHWDSCATNVSPWINSCQT